jgi:hypothetical protein
MAFTFRHLTTGAHVGGPQPAAAAARSGLRAELTALAPLLARLGYAIARCSPDDGVTRYRIVPAGQGYFEAPDAPTALGATAAVSMVRAFLAGFAAGRQAGERDRRAQKRKEP